MKHKFSELLTVILFCGFLFGMTLCYFLLPPTEFSVNEKRYLAEAPGLNWQDVASGDWGEDVESYLADHIPGRDFFVGLNAYFELYTGRQVAKDVWLKGERLVEAPVQPDQKAVSRNMTAINGFADKLDRPVDFLLVPSAGWAMGEAGYSDDAIISDIYAAAGENVNPVDVTQVFAGHPELYFRTDHHWNSAGAHAGYAAYMDAVGRQARPAEEFTKDIYALFQGSTYSRSALWGTEGEPLEVWTGSTNLTVTNGESDQVHQGPFYWERLEEADKYTLFLDGNHSVVRITNPLKEGKLLVIRDSYSNLLGCFLGESYGEVVLVDLRYYKQPISELVAAEGFDDVLVAYSIGNFMTDTNFVWLK